MQGQFFEKKQNDVYHIAAACGIIPQSGSEKQAPPCLEKSQPDRRRMAPPAERIGRFSMKCPYCGYSESKVIDSRPADENSSIRRRRECLSCGKRFTTYETVESLPMVVVKKDGSRQSFDRRKVLGGMIRACEKRPVPLADLEKIAEEIEQDLQNSMEREVSTEAIGEKVMERLRAVDQVAYVRFASVYRQFKDIDTFMAELNKLLADNR